MCGRFALITKGKPLAEAFNIDASVNNPARYNIAPSQEVLIVRFDTKQNKIFSNVHWGLIPSWMKPQDAGSKWINARAETAHEKLLFKRAFQKRRCLIPTDGFYEWQKGKVKTPFYISKNDKTLMTLAGLWEQAHDDEGRVIESCTILTTDANPDLDFIHHRMPVIIPDSLYDVWLDSNTPMEKLNQLLQPYSEGDLDYYPVSPLVNSPKHDVPDCINPL